MNTNRWNPWIVRLLIACLLAPTPARAGGADGTAAEAAAEDVPPPPALAEGGSPARESLDAVQWLRVRRLAPTWTGARMDVLTRSGTVVRGRFRGLQDQALVLAPEEGGTQSVPAGSLRRITLHRRPSDVAMAAVLAIGVAGLFGGVGALGLDTEGGGTAAMAAGGALIGAGIGWRTVCREREIPFD